MVDYVETNFAGVKISLQGIEEERLKEPFTLEANGEEIYTGIKEENIMTTLNHWVHHRGS